MVINIFAVGRQAQAMRVPGIPQLGVTCGRTIEEQLALAALKKERKEKEAEQKRINDEEDRKRAEAAEVRLFLSIFNWF